ncbi:hypothetical protein ACFL50_02110 [Candidatus Latescibacterota bacterium]
MDNSNFGEIMSFCDLHIHSIRSTCGFHTLFEIVSIMKGKGKEAFALTDHSPALGTPNSHFSVLLRRVPPVIDGIRVFKGIEASVLNADGDIDISLFKDFPYEIILAGLHNHGVYENPQGKNMNTRALINAMKKNPSIKLITHPYFELFPVDMDAITDAAIETGTALEVNNSYLLNNKADTDSLALMLELAKKKGTPLVVNSDGHVYNEMGEFDLAEKFMAPYDIDILNIVNRNFESTLEFLELEKLPVFA